MGKSEQALRRALEIDPENADALRNLGALQQQTAPELALAGLGKAARMMPNDQQTQYAYAQCLIDLGASGLAALNRHPQAQASPSPPSA
jgi:tetratricopeptide (TPR) repeat protein